MYDHTLHHERKHFCGYYLQALGMKEISNVNYWFKIYGKQRIKIARKGEYVRLKKYERKIRSLFMIQADFATVLVPEVNGKQNHDESYTYKYQKHVTCTYD